MNRKKSSKQNVTFLSQFLMESFFFFFTCFHIACHVAELHLVYRTTDVVLMLCILLLFHHRLFQQRTRMALLKHLKLYVL